MNKPFTELRKTSQLRRQPKPVPYMTRLPASVVRFLKQTAARYKITQEQLVQSLLLVGITEFEKQKPLTAND